LAGQVKQSVVAPKQLLAAQAVATVADVHVFTLVVLSHA